MTHDVSDADARLALGSIELRRRPWTAEAPGNRPLEHARHALAQQHVVLGQIPRPRRTSS
jgi:hypothetical protein